MLAMKPEATELLLCEIRDAALASIKLTPRETQIARWMLRGASNKDLVGLTDSSIKTVAQHITVIYQKAGVRGMRAFTAFVFPT